MPKAIVAMAAAAVLAAVLAGCPSLAALECSGAGTPTATGCSDGGVGVGTDAGGGGGITCGTGPGTASCAAPAQECCVDTQKVPSCVTALSCAGGTDIFCDAPSQCGGAPCWLCNVGGFQGASCRYQEDIVQAYHCTDPKDVFRLCHSSSDCDAGSVCGPLPVVYPWIDGGSVYGCQP